MGCGKWEELTVPFFPPSYLRFSLPYFLPTFLFLSCLPFHPKRRSPMKGYLCEREGRNFLILVVEGTWDIRDSCVGAKEGRYRFERFIVGGEYVLDNCEKRIWKDKIIKLIFSLFTIDIAEWDVEGLQEQNTYIYLCIYMSQEFSLSGTNNMILKRKSKVLPQLL